MNDETNAEAIRRGKFLTFLLLTNQNPKQYFKPKQKHCLFETKHTSNRSILYGRMLHQALTQFNINLISLNCLFINF